MSGIHKLIIGHSRPMHRNVPPLRNQKYILLRIWRNYNHHDFGIERLLRLFLAAAQFLSLSLYIKQLFHFSGITARKLAVEVYVLLKVLFPLVIFALHLESAPWVIPVIIYLVSETMLYITSIIYLSDVSYEGVSPRRSVTLLFINFFEITFSFAVLYAHFDKVMPGMFRQPLRSATDAIYFSFITAATVGYGDIVPGSDLCRKISVVQIVTTFVFVVLFLNYFAGMLGSQPRHASHVATHKVAHRRKR